VKDFLPPNTKVLDTENYTYYYKQHSCETFSYPHLALHPQASEKEKQLSREKGGKRKLSSTFSTSLLQDRSPLMNDNPSAISQLQQIFVYPYMPHGNCKPLALLCH